MRRKLLFAAAMLLAGVSGMQAQITDGQYYLYNEASSKFLSSGKAWGTQGVLDNFGLPVEILTTEGVTTVRPLIYAAGYLSDNGFTDTAMGDVAKWTVETSGEGYVLKNNNNGMYLTADENGIFTVSAADASSALVWALKTKDERQAIVESQLDANILSAATAAGVTASTVADLKTELANNYAAKDFTSLIKSPTAGSKTDWVFTPGRENYPKPTYNVGSYGGELYQSTGTVSQTIEVESAGLYKVSLNSFVRMGNNAGMVTLGNAGYVMSNAYVSVNGTYYSMIPDWYSDRAGDANPNYTGQASALFNEGKYSMDVYAYVGESKQLTITLNVPTYMGTGWCLFGNFKLAYYSDAVSDAEAEALIAEAEGIVGGKMNGAIQASLTGSLAAFKANRTIANYNALSADVADANTSVAAYTAAGNAINKAKDIRDNNNFATPDAVTAFAGAIADIETAYDNNTLADADAANAGQTLGVAITGWRAAQVGAASYLSSAWDNNGGMDWSTYHGNTWSVEGESDGTGFTVPFIEYWIGDGSTLPAKTMTATLDGFTPGHVYSVKAWIRSRLTNAKKDEIPAGVYLQVNDGAKVLGPSTTKHAMGSSNIYLDYVTAYGTVGEDGKLMVKVIVEEGTNVSWVAFKNVQYKQEEVTTIDENADYTAVGATGVTVKLNRSFVADKWNTIVLPFSLSDEEAKAAFGNDVKVAEFAENSADAGNATVSFTTATTAAIAANTPVLIKTSTTATEFIFGGKTIEAAAEAKVAGTNFSLVGSYNTSVIIPEGCYFIADNQLWKSEGATTLKGMRAYIAPNASGAKIANFIIDGITVTAIDGVKSEAPDNGKVYNLAGQEVKPSKAAKGLYIVKGKKRINGLTN